MEQLITAYYAITTAIALICASLISLVPFKCIQRLSRPIAILIVAFAPITVAFGAIWLIYKICKLIYLKQTIFLSREQKVQMLEKIYNKEEVICR